MSTSFDRLIVHEIGHALDRAPVRPMRTAFVSAVAEQRRFHPQPIPHSHQVTLPPGEFKGWQALHARIRQRAGALERGRTEGGERYVPDISGGHQLTEQLPPGEVNAFRAAAALDGPVRVTEYSDRALAEFFAESFSLYIVEPDTLSRLRPHIYEYFAAKYPDPARPGAAAQPAPARVP